MTKMPLSEKVFHCDCGFAACAQHDTEIVVAAQSHARLAHGTDLAENLILIMARPKENGLSCPAQNTKHERRDLS